MHLAAKQLLNWLSVRPSWQELGRLMLTLFLFQMAWTMVVMSILDFSEWIVEKGDACMVQGILFDRFQQNPSRFFRFLILMAFIEEVIFRLIPLSLALVVAKIRGLSWVVFPVAVLASILFGLVHVFNHGEVTERAVLMSLMLQGVAGLGTCMLFLKYTGLRLRYVLGALVVTTAEHMLWNSFTVTLWLISKQLE